VFFAGGNWGHIGLSDGRGGLWHTDGPTADRIGHTSINWPRDRWGFRNVGWASWLNGSVLPLNMGGGTSPGTPGTPTPPAQEETMDYAEVTRRAAQRVGSNWTWLVFDQNVRNTSNLNFRDGIFSLANRRFEIDLSLAMSVTPATRVSVQALVVDGSNNIQTAYPVQSFNVGGGLVGSRFAGLSGFCPNNRRVRIRVRSLDAACDITPYAVVRSMV